MLRGIYTSALGMITQQHRMDVVSNNIANVNTTGFKRDSVAAQSFSSRLSRRIDDPAELPIFDRMPIGWLEQGLFIDEVFTDFANGTLRQTGGPLDLALVGQGFFSVSVTAEDGSEVERFTRDGAFTLAENGTLVTMDGARVLGLNGNIVLPNGEIAINETGSIFVNEVYVDTLRVVNFEDLTTLRKTGDNLFATTEFSVMMDFGGRMEQGFLENSNVNSVREMVELIALSRAYEANQRMVTIQDESLGRAVNDIARR